MDVKLDYEQGISEIDQMLAKLPKEMEGQVNPLLKKIGSIVKDKLKKYLHDSDVGKKSNGTPPSNYDGSRPYVHVKDDIKSNVRKDKSGTAYVSIRGGKMTGYKWHMINDGHFARDARTWVQGTNFMDKAMRDVQGEADKAINDAVKKVTG